MSRPIRIAHVATVDATVRFLLLSQLTRLRDEGYEVTAISAPGRWIGEVEASGIRHVPWPHITRAWDPSADGRAFAELRRILERERFDLVHTHNPKPGLMGRIAARRAGVPCVVNTVHGLYASRDDGPARRMAVVAAERLAARFSDLELYQSEEDLAWARRIDLAGGARTVLLGNGVDVNRFDPVAVPPARVAAVRQELGIEEDAVVVGTIGRLVAEKGYRELRAAARRVRRMAPHVRFVAVGPRDPAKGDAISADELSGAEEDILFCGWRDDVPELLAAMDVFVLASWREGVPRSAIEAAAMARPLVVTDIRGCREVVREGREGLLVPKGDAARLSDAILRLVDDRELRERMGSAARTRTVELFDERKVADTLVREYGRLLEQTGVMGADADFEGLGRVRIRAARHEEARAMAHLHAVTHPHSFLPELGERFLEVLYRAHIEEPTGVALVAEAGGRVVGYTTGLHSTEAFRRRFVRRYGVAAGLAAAPHLVRRSVLRRFLELGRYPRMVRGLPRAEWTFIALDPSVHARGLGTALGRQVLRALQAGGATAVKTFVARDNEPSNRMVRRLGFEPRGQIAIHDGEASTLYLVRCPSS